MLMLLRLKTLLKAIVFPPTGPLLLAVLGLLLIKRRPRLARACLILAVGSLWVLSSPWGSDALVGLAEHYPPLDLRSTEGAQAIVILGGGGQRAFAPEYGGPAAEPLLLERLGFGAYIARKTGLPILVTGYHVEAIAMRDTLERNFDTKVRWVDDQSYDTYENARNSVRLLKAADVHRVVLVTHATHMWRSVHEFTAAGIEVVPAPMGILAEREPGYFDFLPNADALLRTCAAINELVGEPMRILLAALHLRRQQ
jgi:uncharacterized SAM-binding protein YcdF (DUF218 family)